MIDFFSENDNTAFLYALILFPFREGCFYNRPSAASPVLAMSNAVMKDAFPKPGWFFEVPPKKRF
jgi:hypothetical protein